MHQKLSSAGGITQTLDMVWLELTSFCNLECIHCYANSGPTGKHAALSEEKYREIISEAADLHCQRLQFIGGEPTAFKALPSLISHARMSGIRSIEVFTNATLLSEKIVNCFSDNNVHVFVSFYSFDPTVHDAITKHSGSFQRTVAGISRLLELNIPTTVCVIEMDLNRGHFDATKSFLNRIGVRHVHFDAIRKFGRGISDEIPSERNASACEADVAFGELCGQCGNGKLAVLPDGTVSPCVMARSRVVGSALDTPLNALLLGPQMQEFRTELKKVREDRVAHGVQGTDVIEFPDRRGGGQSQSNLGGSELAHSRVASRLEECGPNTNTDPMCSPGTPQPEQCSPDTNTVPMCSPGTPQPEQCSPDTNTVPMCSPGTPQPEQCSPDTNTEPMCSPGTPQPEQCSPDTNTVPMCSPGTPQPEQCSPDTNTVPMCSPGTPQPEQCSPDTNT
ncbi:radical SAM protein, partial [Rhizobium leguminosarum]